MVFKKPYAFLIKHFKLINGILASLLIIFLLILNKLHELIKSIYMNNISNYSTLTIDYIGFKTVLLIFLILGMLSIIIILLRKKNKPLKDYLYAFIYIVLIIAYLFSTSSLFLKLQDTIVEQTKLNLYNDISFLIYLPLVYFIVKFILIFIGFNLKKFNFSKDIEDLKATLTDNEEVEIILNKNYYKYFRRIKKYFREFKYYYLENKFIINIILFGIIGIFSVYFIGFNLFFNKSYKINSIFQAGSFTYKVNSSYETNRDFNNNVIKKGFKYVVVSIDIKNNYYESKSINFNDIRLAYGNDYVYANNYYNNLFLDLGVPYNNQVIKNGETKTFSFIFKIPEKYTSSRYKLKIYDKIDFEDKKQRTIYKIVKFKSKIITKTVEETNINLNKKEYIDEKSYGESYLNIKSYDIKGSYQYNYKDCLLSNCIDKTGIIGINDANNILLILEYKLKLDKNFSISEYFTKDKYFFESFIKLNYFLNNKEYNQSSVKVINSGIDNRVFLSVNRNIENASKIEIILNLRNKKIIYNLK